MIPLLLTCSGSVMVSLCGFGLYQRSGDLGQQVVKQLFMLLKWKL